MKVENITVRPLETVEDFKNAEEVQRLAWGMADIEVAPVHVVLTAAKNGGLVLGAFDGTQMVGFLFSFLGRTPAGKDKLCSHMVGVIPKYRQHGIAAALKWQQREFALSQGLDLVTWTYDPLESPNAYLNIVKLGTICRTYIRNLYGEMDDALNAGLPTDRFEVEWWVRSSRVAARSSKEAPSSRVTLQELLDRGAAIVNQVEPGDAGLPETLSWEPYREAIVLVEIPPYFQELKQTDSELARDWRLLTRALFEEYFDDGYVVVDFLSQIKNEQRRNFYILEHGADIETGP